MRYNKHIGRIRINCLMWILCRISHSLFSSLVVPHMIDFNPLLEQTVKYGPINFISYMPLYVTYLLIYTSYKSLKMCIYSLYLMPGIQKILQMKK